MKSIICSVLVITLLLQIIGCSNTYTLIPTELKNYYKLEGNLYILDKGKKEFIIKSFRIQDDTLKGFGKKIFYSNTSKNRIEIEDSISVALEDIYIIEDKVLNTKSTFYLIIGLTVSVLAIIVGGGLNRAFRG